MRGAEDQFDTLRVDDARYRMVSRVRSPISPPDAGLRDGIIAVRADEANHRDVNHEFADRLS